MKPSPQIGDWLQAKGPWSKIVLKFYSSPPLVLLLEHYHGRRFLSIEMDAEVQPWQYIGPVHLVSEDHHDFVSVLVPHPQSGLLNWVNIWGFGQPYCHIVSDNVLADWCRQGFHNMFRPETEILTERGRLASMRERFASQENGRRKRRRLTQGVMEEVEEVN